MTKKKENSLGDTSEKEPNSDALGDLLRQRAEVVEKIETQKESILKEIEETKAEAEKHRIALEVALTRVKELEDLVGIHRNGRNKKTGKLKDPQTGTVYASYAEACAKSDIQVGTASAHRKWMASKGKELEVMS